MSLVTAPSIQTTLVELLSDGLFVDGDWVESKDQDPDGEVRLIQLADVGDGIFRNRSSRFLKSSKAKELRCTFLEPGDILVARMPEPLGRACIFPGVGQPAVTAVDVCIIRPNPKRVHAPWLVSTINSPDFRSAMQQYVRGTTRQRISRKNLGTLELRVPTIAEQVGVANTIEWLGLRRGSASDHIGAATRAIERFRQAVLAAACSGRLTADWRAAQGFEDGDLPRGWVRVSGRDAFPFITSGSRGWAKYYSDEGPLFLRVGNLDHDSLDLDLTEVQRVAPPDSAEARRTAVRPGDLLISVTADIGMVGVAPRNLDEAHVNQHVAIARPDPSFNPRFLAAFVAALTGGQAQLGLLQRGATKAGLGLDDIRALEIPVPSRAEQDEVVHRVDRLLESAEELGRRIKAAGKRVDRSSQAALAKAFRGDMAIAGNVSGEVDQAKGSKAAKKALRN